MAGGNNGVVDATVVGGDLVNILTILSIPIAPYNTANSPRDLVFIFCSLFCTLSSLEGGGGIWKALLTFCTSVFTIFELPGIEILDSKSASATAAARAGNAIDSENAFANLSSILNSSSTAPVTLVKSFVTPASANDSVCLLV